MTEEPEITEETEENLDPETGQSWEDVAKNMGWHPQEEYNGDPENFTSAEDFVKKGRETLPILRDNNRTMSRKLAELEKLVTEQKKFTERQLEVQKQEYEAKLREAVENGDVEKYDQLRKSEPEPPKVDNAVNEFMVKNEWYGVDTVMTAAAEALSAKYAKDFPTLSVEQNLEKVRQAIVTEFPHKFSNGKGGSPVESGRRSAPKKSGKSFDALPADAKAMCDSFIKQGIIKDRDEYVKTYDWSE